MNEVEIFFQNLGEVWRDITVIEFLMRCAIMKKEGEELKFPKPPYKKGKIYKNYPDSFSHYSFEIITKKFNKKFPNINIPTELIQLRDAMAHGLIAEIDNNKTQELIKFKENKDQKELQIEFCLSLGSKKFSQIRQSLMELRRYIMQEISTIK